MGLYDLIFVVLSVYLVLRVPPQDWMLASIPTAVGAMLFAESYLLAVFLCVLWFFLALAGAFIARPVTKL